MTEDNELDLMDLCVEAGKDIGPCSECSDVPSGWRSTCNYCAGTGVKPPVLTRLYELATDVADLVDGDEMIRVADMLRNKARHETGANN